MNWKSIFVVALALFGGCSQELSTNVVDDAEFAGAEEANMDYRQRLLDRIGDINNLTISNYLDRLFRSKSFSREITILVR